MQYHPRLIHRTIFARPRVAVYPHRFDLKPRNEIPMEQPKPAQPPTPLASGNPWYYLTSLNPECTAYTDVVWTDDTSATMTRSPREPAVTGAYRTTRRTILDY